MKKVVLFFVAGAALCLASCCGSKCEKAAAEAADSTVAAVEAVADTVAAVADSVVAAADSVVAEAAK